MPAFPAPSSSSNSMGQVPGRARFVDAAAECPCLSAACHGVSSRPPATVRLRLAHAAATDLEAAAIGVAAATKAAVTLQLELRLPLQLELP